jgi:hypothetical protein
VVLGGKHTRGREHRTEVTEGDLEPVADERLFVDSVGFRRVTHARERASHRGHRGHRGGFRAGCVRELFVDSVGFRRVTHALGREHRTEVTEATEGDLEPVADGRLFVDSVGFRRVTHALGREHRTEVTEAYSNYQLGARLLRTPTSAMTTMAPTMSNRARQANNGP